MNSEYWKKALEFEDIIFEKSEEGIAKITINRPEVRNAFRPLTVREMQQALEDAREDSGIGVIILTGAGEKAFCSGGDQRIRGDAGYQDSGTGHLRLNVLDFQRQIRSCPKPVVAMVAGYAIGGGHVLHVMCDLSIAADNAVFGQTGPKVGSFDGGYGSSYLARIVGQKKAREIWFLCRQYDARQALEMGLVNTVVPLAQLEEETIQWCREMLRMSPIALRCLKAAMNADCDGQAGLQELAGNATSAFICPKKARKDEMPTSKNAHRISAALPATPNLGNPATSGFSEPLSSESSSTPVWKSWFLALRPKTLGAGIAPVLIGTSMAFEAEKGHLFSALAALLGALLIQIGTNLSNDYFDFVKGADTEERLGPARATQAGWIRPEIILRSSLLVFAAAVIIGIFLVLRGGWPIVLIGIASVICGILYTGGPYPLAYLGLGEIFVVIFFGPVATLGTYYVQALEFSKEVFIAGLAPGLISTALIAVNNLRDIPTDIKARKRTLAVRFGYRFARIEYTLCILGGLFIPLFLVVMLKDHWFSLIASFAVIPAFFPIRDVVSGTSGEMLNDTLAKTGKVLLIFSILFSAGWLIG